MPRFPEFRDRPLSLAYTNAWNAVIDTLVKRFDLEILSQPDGYARTTWLYSWTAKLNENYRVRITVRFAPDRRSIRVKTEAQVKDGDNWILGNDTRLLTTLRTDLMGTIGRTTQ